MTIGHHWTRWCLGAVGLAVLLGCTEREEVLPGKREPIEAVLSTLSPDALPVVGDLPNESLPITLPATEANADASQFEGSPAFRTAHPALGGQLTRVWSANIGQGDVRKQRITADPAISGDRIYTLDSATTVTAVSTSGQVIWQRDIRPARDGEGDATGGGVSVSDGTVYVSSGFGRVVALDAATGATRWEQDLDATGSGRPLVVGELLYVTAGDAVGWALEAGTGRIAWQTTAAPTVTNVLGAPAPVLADDLVVFAFGSGEIQALFRRGGLRRWDSSVLGEREGRALSRIDDVTAAPVVSGDRLYIGSQAGRTVALNAGSGLRIWTAQEGAISPVLPVGGSVFLVSDRNELLRLDAETGARIWGQRLPNFVSNRPRRSAEVFAHHGPVLAGGRLLVASGDGQLRSFDPESGALVGRVEIPDGATTRPIVAGQTVYVIGRKGQLHAFR